MMLRCAGNLLNPQKKGRSPPNDSVATGCQMESGGGREMVVGF
jgi:hypothetical protein